MTEALPIVTEDEVNAIAWTALKSLGTMFAYISEDLLQEGRLALVKHFRKHEDNEEYARSTAIQVARNNMVNFIRGWSKTRKHRVPVVSSVGLADWRWKLQDVDAEEEALIRLSREELPDQMRRVGVRPREAQMLLMIYWATAARHSCYGRAQSRVGELFHLSSST